VSISISVNGAQVAAAFDVTSKAAFNAVRGAVEESANEVRNDWKKNAQAHVRHPKHSGWYPKTIKAERRGPLSFDVFPDAGKGKGEGFEFGSRKQPPHLDGQRAMDSVTPKFERRLNTALGRVL
jgi:hypothetical protein